MRYNVGVIVAAIHYFVRHFLSRRVAHLQKSKCRTHSRLGQIMHFYTLLDERVSSPIQVSYTHSLTSLPESRDRDLICPLIQAHKPHPTGPPATIAHQPPTAYQCTSAPTPTQSEPRTPAQGTGRIDAVVSRARHDPKGLGIP
jgi:hypothetical protein